VVDGQRLTYVELEAAAAATARRVAARGVGEGDRVTTTLPAGRRFAELLHALPRLGAVLVPLDPRAPAQVNGAVSVDGDLPTEEAEVELRPRVDPDAIHSIIHTSGTGGRPKPVELSYRNHHASALACAEAVGSRSDDRWLSVLPPFHVAGLAILVRAAVGATTAILHERFEPETVKGALEEGEATLVSLVPTMLARLREIGFQRAPALRALLLGGGPIPRELLRWTSEEARLPVVPVYGMTETASLVASGSPGVPVRGAELRISDDGEILVRGPMCARGELDPDGWVHSGDGGRLDERGRLHVEGRLKELIVSGGENISPVEVENVLLSHPAVADAAVLGLPDPDWGEAVTAFVVLRVPASAEELIDHCRGSLAPHKVPKRIEQVAGLPRSPAGKLLRGEIVP
jgi:O-succinylbenzoic acid--CoA ligase